MRARNFHTKGKVASIDSSGQSRLQNKANWLNLIRLAFMRVPGQAEIMLSYFKVDE